MPLATKPFDPAEYLTSAEAQAYLLQDALEEGDPAYLADALGIIARARGMTDTAAKAGVTREALYKALSLNGDPKLSTLMGVLRALGLRMRLEPIEGSEEP
jgi:probable addiction module antidote protein